VRPRQGSAVGFGDAKKSPSPRPKPHTSPPRLHPPGGTFSRGLPHHSCSFDNARAKAEKELNRSTPQPVRLFHFSTARRDSHAMKIPLQPPAQKPKISFAPRA